MQDAIDIGVIANWQLTLGKWQGKNDSDYFGEEELRLKMLSTMHSMGTDKLLEELHSTDWSVYFNSDPIEILRRKIASLSKNEASAEAVIDMLSQIEWQSLLEQEIQRQIAIKESHEAFRNALVPCTRCNQTFHRYQLNSYITGVSSSHSGYCDECAKRTIQELTRVCDICCTQYMANRVEEVTCLCKICRTEERMREAQKVCAQNSRAKSMQLAGTLTLKSWLEALSYFGWACAYCKGKYQCLEHYIPMVEGGGTTADNCVPACNRCNMRKSDRHPNEFDRLFPQSNLTLIRSYLAMQASEQVA